MNKISINFVQMNDTTILQKLKSNSFNHFIHAYFLVTAYYSIYHFKMLYYT